MAHRLPKTRLPSWTPATTATLAVTLAAAVASAGFGVHRLFGLRGLVAEIAVNSFVAATLVSAVVRSTRRWPAIAVGVIVVIFFVVRAGGALFLVALGEPTPEQSNASGEVAWLLYPLVFSFTTAKLLSNARRGAARSSLEPRWAIDLDAGLLLLLLAAGSLFAVRGVRGEVGDAARIVAIAGGVLGLSFVIDRAVAIGRARRLLELASGGGKDGVSVRPCQRGEELLPSLSSEGASEVVAIDEERPGGGPFREGSESRGVFRWDRNDQLVPFEAGFIGAKFMIAIVWIGFGMFHASTSLDPNHPPFEVATRYRHFPILRVGDPALELGGHSFWRGPTHVVTYDEARDAIVDEPDAVLRRYPEADSLEIVARRSSLLRHSCVVVTSGEVPLEGGERVQAAPPRRVGDAIEYECATITYPQEAPVIRRRFTDRIAPQRLPR